MEGMKADFDVMTVCPPTSPFVALAPLVTIAYALILMVVWIRHAYRHEFGIWRTDAPSLLAAMPLAMNVPLVWLLYIRVAQVMSLSGGGRGALSAGLAEALFRLFIGAVVSAGLAIALLIHSAFAARASQRVTTGSGWLPSSTIGLIAFASAATWWFSHRLFQTAAFSRHVHLATEGAITGGLLLLIVALLTIRAIRTRSEVPPWRAHFIALAIVVLMSSGIALGVWHTMEMYRVVAMGRVNGNLTSSATRR